MLCFAEMCREACLAIDGLPITGATVLENLWPVLSILVKELAISHDKWVDCNAQDFQKNDFFLFVRIFDSRCLYLAIAFEIIFNGPVVFFTG